MRTIFYISIVLILFSCSKNELKQPTDVGVRIDINRNSSSSGHLSFNDGYLRLGSFSIEGERQEGSDVELSKEFEQGNVSYFSASTTVNDLDIEIPQGNYTDLDINFNVFDDDDEPTIVVNGFYTNESNQTFPILFEFLSSEYFSINSEAEDGGSVITLDKDLQSYVLIKLDPIYWFDIITTNSLDTATLTEIDGVMTILINEEYNENIYELIADRIDEQTSSVFSN